MSEKRFRIAFSFAGEKRAYVKQVADLLAQKFSEAQILYDKFHEAEFARYDLGVYLPKLYREQADLVVAVICKSYDEKQWTGWEWMAIYSQLTKREGQNIMLARFDYAHVDGLFDAAAFVELDQKTPEQAAMLILERLALNEGRAKDHYTKSDKPPNTTIPNNLPQLQYFFGREADLQKIANALAEDARGWGALIDGPGGIGKTTLAIRAAELVPPGRFRRIIFLSAKERELSADGQRPLGNFVLPGYLEMLNAIARELEQPELAKSVESERADAVLRALRDENALLLLDNLETLPASDRDQLFAFLNRLPRGCSALVTSRRRADASAVNLRLDKLEWIAAHDLMNEIAQHNDRLLQASATERRALYDETGGNPLLMRWVAGQLGAGRCRTIVSALDFLRSAPPGNNPLEFIFGDLLDVFTDNETKVLAALAHFTTPMETKFIAELAALNQAAAEGALSDLSSRALVLPDLEERRFVLVPMVADFLRRARPEAVAETGNRLEQYAYTLILENGEDKYERFPTLDAAWPKVAPAFPLFVAGSNERLQTVCYALGAFLDFTGRWDEWLSLCQQAEAKAVAVGDYDKAGRQASMAGWVHYLRQQEAAVLACADRAATHWQSVQAGTREHTIAIVLRGHGHRLKKDYPAAIAAYRESLALWRSLSAENQNVAIALNALANAERESGDLAASERDFREALRIARAVGYAEGEAYITGNLALLAIDREDWLEAKALAREALLLSEKVGRQELIAHDCRYLAEALMRQGESAEARPYALRAVEIFTRLGVVSDIKVARATLDECDA